MTRVLYHFAFKFIVFYRALFFLFYYIILFGGLKANKWLSPRETHNQDTSAPRERPLPDYPVSSRPHAELHLLVGLDQEDSASPFGLGQGDSARPFGLGQSHPAAIVVGFGQSDSAV